MITLVLIVLVTLGCLLSAATDSYSISETFYRYFESLKEASTKMLYICIVVCGVILDLMFGV